MKAVRSTDAFVFFWSGWPSQWYPSPFEIDGVRYSCAEQFMMAEKARVFGDLVSAEAILQADHPRKQKALGRRVRAFDQDIWNSVCLGVVFRGNVAKFSQCGELRNLLAATGQRRMVEASPLDTVWGIGLAPDDPRADDPAQWRGTNWLGQTLDQVRRHLSEARGENDLPSDAALCQQIRQRNGLLPRP